MGDEVVYFRRHATDACTWDPWFESRFERLQGDWDVGDLGPPTAHFKGGAFMLSLNEAFVHVPSCSCAQETVLCLVTCVHDGKNRSCRFAIPGLFQPHMSIVR